MVHRLYVDRSVLSERRSASTSWLTRVNACSPPTYRASRPSRRTATPPPIDTCECVAEKVRCVSCAEQVGYHVTQVCNFCERSGHNGHFWIFQIGEGGEHHLAGGVVAVARDPPTPEEVECECDEGRKVVVEGRRENSVEKKKEHDDDDDDHHDQIVGDIRQQWSAAAGVTRRRLLLKG